MLLVPTDQAHHAGALLHVPLKPERVTDLVQSAAGELRLGVRQVATQHVGLMTAQVDRRKDQARSEAIALEARNRAVGDGAGGERNGSLGVRTLGKADLDAFALDESA